MIELLNKLSRKNIVTVINSNNWETINNFEINNLKLNINFELLKNQLLIVESLIHKNTCDNSWMGECAKYHLDSGGKRFRAALALVTGQIFKLDEQSSIYVAASCELIHNASLIHDDLQDRDLLRRGNPTIWSRFGDSSAINLGDYFISSAFEILSDSPSNEKFKCMAIKEFSMSIKQALAGQTREIQTRADLNLKMQDYESTARAKTGSLLSLPVKLILILSGKKYSNESLNSIYETGLAYQIQDDLSDFIGIKERELPGRDLKEGKMNALVMHYLNEATTSEKYLLNMFLKKRFESISEEEIYYWISKIQEKKIIEKTINHLYRVIINSINLSESVDTDFYQITKFIIKNILLRISKKLV